MDQDPATPPLDVLSRGHHPVTSQTPRRQFHSFCLPFYDNCICLHHSNTPCTHSNASYSSPPTNKHAMSSHPRSYPQLVTTRRSRRDTFASCSPHRHSGEKPYSCTQCNYRAAQLGHLNEHKQIHSDTKRKVYARKEQQCPHCDYKAKQKSHMTAHIRMHTRDRPFECDQCDYTAVQRSHLRTHMLTHTGEKRFKCELCEYRAARKCQVCPLATPLMDVLFNLLLSICCVLLPGSF